MGGGGGGGGGRGKCPRWHRDGGEVNRGVLVVLVLTLGRGLG